MPTKQLKLIAVTSENMCIGKNNRLPWNLKNELNYFKKLTKTTSNSKKINAVVMGRRTWESIPERNRPLSGRLNVVLTKSVAVLKRKVDESVLVFDDFNLAINTIQNDQTVESIWIIGGSSLYQTAMNHSDCYRIYMTEIMKHYECDTYFPKIDSKFKLLKDHGKETDLVPMEKQIEDEIEYYFRIYEKEVEL